MASYWLKHEDGTVLGPVSLNVVRELARAGQLKSVREASTTGRSWLPARQFPELASALETPAQGAPPGAQASAIRAELAAARRQAPHEIFGLRFGATLNEFRTAFFDKVKRYHPQRLPPSASQEVRVASGEMFQFLSDLMLTIQRQGGSTGATPPTGRPAAPPPSFAPDEFVGLEQKGNDRVEARVLVGKKTAELFTAHKLVNISTGGFFLSGRTYPLGMAFDVTLRFEGSPETLSARGKVVLESAGNDPRQPRGTGVQLILSSTERTFLQSFIGSMVAKQPTKAR